MLLKPATPLTLLLLVAFVLLLLSVLSTPIVKNIPLATFDNVEYGVLGYCKAGKCTAIHVGYTTEDIKNTGSSDSDFNLPSDARKSLSSILIVHPIAAFLTLICLCLAAAAHFHAPSHSPRYLLGLLILLLPTLLVSLLAFLVDILLFVPHLSWGGWIVLAATIILVTCGVVTCAMRRTLVSRKARKRRIAENAEMSGENYYNRQNVTAAGMNEPKPIAPEAKEAFVTASQSSDSAPTFATFRTTTRESDDDRTPLNKQSDLSGPDSTYPARIPGDPVPYNAPRDEFGTPLPYSAGSRMRTPGLPDSRLRDQYSDQRRAPRPPGFAPRGRGGYPPRRGYGRGGPYGGVPVGPNARGPPPGRGGPLGPARGGPPGLMARGGYRPPPAAAGYGPGSRHMGEDEYGYRGPSPRQQSPGPVGMAVSAEPGPVGQAIEMMPQQRRESEPQESMPDPRQPHLLSNEGQPEPVSPSSLYSRSPTYVPPRANWAQQGYQSSEPNLTYQRDQSGQPYHIRSHSGSLYYEDEDPTYTSRNESAVNNPQVPSALTPGTSGEQKLKENGVERPSSPAASEVSHFTSISERPINPKWRPPPMPAQAAQQKRDVLLENNPDFDLRAGVGRGGRMPPLSRPNVLRYPVP
ncbi:putative pH signal transduction protein PalI [Aspergillus lucknowensis]|uniref:SUR7/PalI family-domain-containing protein n=1 Tax=Aspergillus lucknowensis TaxID=176173 RepID=A0ABR4LR45_9EURO